jgi:hypothetical protein
MNLLSAAAKSGDPGAMSLAAQLALIKTDVANVKTLQDATRTALVAVGVMKGAA